jgi:organic hydroperoxide reductase OsmC/OhrA
MIAVGALPLGRATRTALQASGALHRQGVMSHPHQCFRMSFMRKPSQHHYAVTVEWTGNRGTGTSGYQAYGRQHVIQAAGKPDIPGSSDPAFLGDKTRWNPEDMLVASTSACHKLWYLHLCSDAGIRVLSYRDDAVGTMVEDAGGGHFTQIVLRPQVVIQDGDDRERAHALHEAAHQQCFIANSLNFPVRCEATVDYAQAAS